MPIVDFHKRLERAEKKLNTSAIYDENKKLIRQFVNFKTAEGVTIARQHKYITTLRLIAERYLDGGSFIDLTKEDLVGLVAKIERSKLGAWSKHDYEVILKTFYKYLDKDQLVSWLKIRSPKKLPDELITEQEIMAMIDAAYLLRDKAFIAMLYEGGFRISELGELRIKDISFDRYGAIAMVTGKTGPRRVRLIWSMPYIAQYLETHQLRSDKNAPFWYGNHGAFNYEAMRAQLKKIAKRAGVQKKVNPHNFRHSRSTHLASKLTESQMEEYLGWVQGSKMPSIYVHMSGRDLDRDLLKMYGLEAEEEKEEELKTLQCPHCRTLNTTGARICMNCRKPLTVEEAMAREEEVMSFMTDFMELAAKDPELIHRFKEFGASSKN
jgi:integrase/recombinase XerD